MACRGTWTVRIFEARNLKARKWPDYIDEATALRDLQWLVDKATAEEKETGCEHVVPVGAARRLPA